MSSPENGVDAGEHLVEHDAEREDVGAVVERLSRDLLGRHVARRAQQHARGRLHVRVAQPRDAEVHDLHAAVGEHHDVAGLHVAVDDAALVGRRERLGHARGDLHRLRGRERAAADEVAQLPAVEYLHRHEGDVALAPDVVDGDDRRVPDAAGRPRLLQEARLEVRALLVGAGQRDRLDGHRSGRAPGPRRARRRPWRRGPSSSSTRKRPNCRGLSRRSWSRHARCATGRAGSLPGFRSARSPVKLCVTVMRSPGSRLTLRSRGG